VAAVRVAHSKHASQNPKALLKERVTVQDVVGSRWICKPLHLLDCCVETDNATCIIVTSAERARDLKQKPAYVMGVAGRVNKPRTDFHWAAGPISRVAGYYAKDIVFGQAGIKPDDVDITGSYDAFTFTTMLQLEEYGFCKKGEGGPYVSSGIIELGASGRTTPRGHLCEGYTHGMSMVIENVRQLRGLVDDYCPGWAEGKHSYDYAPGKCRQVKDAKITMNLGWAMPPTAPRSSCTTNSLPLPHRGEGQVRGTSKWPASNTRHEPGDTGETTPSGASTSSWRAVTSSCCAPARRAASCATRPATAGRGARPRMGVEGGQRQGHIYSYEVVHHAIQPGFKDWTPYAIVLVELDEQRGTPTPDEALRIIGNLVTADFAPEPESKVAIGKRVRVVFQDLASDFALPHSPSPTSLPSAGLEPPRLTRTLSPLGERQGEGSLPRVSRATISSYALSARARTSSASAAGSDAPP
jgi:hypothetical protein